MCKPILVFSLNKLKNLVYAKFQLSIMPGAGQKVCVGGVGAVGWVRWGGCKPILVFSFGQAEQLCLTVTELG